MSGQPELSVCFPNYQDWGRLQLVIQTIRMYNRDVRHLIEIVVADNSPNHPDAKQIKFKLETRFNQAGMGGTKYVAVQKVSSCGAKNAAIAAASGKAVLVMDSHIVLEPNSLRNLLAHYRNNPDTLDLFTGPLLWDELIAIDTHLDDRFRGSMWGTQSRAWRTPEGEHVSIYSDDQVRCQYAKLEVEMPPWQGPDLPWAGHREVLESQGWHILGSDPADIFEVPLAYNGVFSCRKEAWIPFHPMTTGFGGEEGTLHSNFRKAGRKVYCLGFLRWWHPFEDGTRPDRSPGRSIQNLVGNLLLNGGPVDRIRQHFVEKEKTISAEWFDMVVKQIHDNPQRFNPVSPPHSPSPSPPARPQPQAPRKWTSEELPALHPGSELHLIFTDLEFHACTQCVKMAQAMDIIGPNACRACAKELAEDIFTRAAQVKDFNWKERMQAAEPILKQYRLASAKAGLLGALQTVLNLSVEAGMDAAIKSVLISLIYEACDRSEQPKRARQR